jgi:hypothetical protein
MEELSRVQDAKKDIDETNNCKREKSITQRIKIPGNMHYRTQIN